MLEAIFWGSLLLVVYSYALYPILLVVAARMAGTRQPAVAGIERRDRPSVACIVSAFNEEAHIDARITNFLAQAYPEEKLTVLVGSDGSRDRTAELIEARAGGRVQAFAFERNRGKASVLNDLVAACDAEILVFSDANTMFEPDAVERLVAHFSDPTVGVVCGELRLLDAKGNNQDSAYWRLEQLLKRLESQLGGLLGANGGIYAMRRGLYRPLAPDSIIDDFCIAMTAAAEGWKLVYEPKAVAVEDTPDKITDEYLRRVRIGIGNYQAFFRHPEYLLRTNNVTRFAYFSHKVLRWFTPHLLIVALGASFALAFGSQFYLGLFLLQLAGYGSIALVHTLSLDNRLPRLAHVVLFFCALNWAFLVAFVRYLSGEYSGSWRSTARG